MGLGQTQTQSQPILLAPLPRTPSPTTRLPSGVWKRGHCLWQPLRPGLPRTFLVLGQTCFPGNSCLEKTRTKSHPSNDPEMGQRGRGWGGSSETSCEGGLWGADTCSAWTRLRLGAQIWPGQLESWEELEPVHRGVLLPGAKMALSVPWTLTVPQPPATRGQTPGLLRLASWLMNLTANPFMVPMPRSWPQGKG